MLVNYTNPYSTTPITGISTKLQNSAGTQRAYYSSSTLQGIEADGINAANV
jgi:hypothetical protein